jgi:hypothetical protein
MLRSIELLETGGPPILRKEFTTCLFAFAPKRSVVAVNILRPHGLFTTLLEKSFGGIEREAYGSDFARIVSSSGD